MVNPSDKASQVLKFFWKAIKRLTLSLNSDKQSLYLSIVKYWDAKVNLELRRDVRPLDVRHY